MKIWFLIEKINGYHCGRLRELALHAHQQQIELEAIELFDDSTLYTHDSHSHSNLDVGLLKWRSLSMRRTEVNAWQIASRLILIAKNERPNIIISLGFYQGYFIIFRFKASIHLPSIKWIFCSETKADDGPRNWFKEIFKRLMVRLFDGALVGGVRHKNYWSSLGMDPANINIGYDVVDNHKFSQLSLVDKEKFNNFNILCVARLVSRKSVDLLLKAFTQSNLGPDWRLVIAGAGPLDESLKQLSNSLGIADRVDFLGAVQNSHMLDIYKSASIFVLPSAWDQWGLAANEAMAAGIPVIVSDRCGCAGELVVHGITGLVFPAGSCAHLSGYLKLLASNIQMRKNLAVAGLSFVKAWGTDTFAVELLNLVKSNNVCQKL